MKRRMLSILIVVISLAVAYFISLYNSSLAIRITTEQHGNYTVKYVKGSPFYVVGETLIDANNDLIQKVDYMYQRTILMFALFCIPIFFAGSLWASKKNVPNQGMDPTR